MTKTEGEAADLEQSLEELERLVEQLEQGDLALEASLELFEQGVRLTRRCQGALRDAEQRVEKLIETNGELAVVPLDQRCDDENETSAGNKN